MSFPAKLTGQFGSMLSAAKFSEEGRCGQTGMASDLRPHHDRCILGNGGDRRLQRGDNILKSTKI